MTHLFILTSLHLHSIDSEQSRHTRHPIRTTHVRGEQVCVGRQSQTRQAHGVHQQGTEHLKGPLHFPQTKPAVPKSWSCSSTGPTGPSHWNPKSSHGTDPRSQSPSWCRTHPPRSAERKSSWKCRGTADEWKSDGHAGCASVRGAFYQSGEVIVRR